MMVAKYFLFSSGIAPKIRKHKAVLKALLPFRKKKLIAFRSTLMYILPYLSRAFDISQKQKILIDHYSFLEKNFPSMQFSQLFGSGLHLYHEMDNNDNYSIILKSVTNHLEFEGSMSLLFNQNDSTLYSLSFTFIKGEVLGFNDPYIIFLSALQGVKDKLNQIRVSTKHFKENSIPVILLKTLEVIAFAFDINRCVGISAKNHLSLKTSVQYEQFFNNYDLFWISNGATCLKGNYLLKLPLRPKPILQIAQTHRNRTLKKRQKIKEVTDDVSKSILVILYNDQHSQYDLDCIFMINEFN